MAQQNQEINLVDPESFPLRRKRGRPRKYDGPGYEARRRYLSPQSIPNPANLAGSSQGARVTNTTLNFSPQATSVQVNPTVHPYPDVQAIPTQVNHVPISSVRPDAIPPQPTTVHPPVSGSQRMQSQANAKCNSTSTLSYGIGTYPAQTTPIANSNSSHQCVLPASSSHVSHTLVGQPVSGILDGTFDAGYLLTVKVGNTGDVLKGLVFDPRLCVPVSAENDIAPLLPLANSRQSPHSVAKTPIQPVPTPICSAHITAVLPVQTKEPSAPAQSVDYVHESSTSKDSKTSPESIFLKVATDDSNPGHHEIAETTQAEVCATIPQTLEKETIDSENQKSLSDGIQQCAGNNVTSEISLCPAVSKEVHANIPQTLDRETISSDDQKLMSDGFQQTAGNNVTSDIALCPAVSKENDQNQCDQILNLTEASALDESQVQNDKSLPVMEEAPGKAEGAQQTEKSKNENKEAEGDQGQNLERAPSAGLMPEVSSTETSDKRQELPDIVDL